MMTSASQTNGVAAIYVACIAASSRCVGSDQGGWSKLTHSMVNLTNAAWETNQGTVNAFGWAAQPCLVTGVMPGEPTNK